MPVTDYNMTFKDGGGAARAMLMRDLSGEGKGPFVPVKALVDKDGNLIDRNNPMPISWPIRVPSSTFVRPANTTPYAQGKIVTDSAASSFAGGVPSLTATLGVNRAFRIPRLRLHKTTPLATSATFWIHLFTEPPTQVAADGANFNAAGSLHWLGRTDDIVMTGLVDGAIGIGRPAVGNEFIHMLPSGQLIWWLVEARGAYAPGSQEQFTCTAEVLPN